MSRKGNDRYSKEDALPSDGSENDRDSGDDEDARQARSGRGANPKGGAQKGQQLYCVCKRPYSETEFMICCDGCENWFHGRCVGVTESMAQSIDTYYCPDCQQNRGDEEEEAERVPPPPPPPPKEEKKVFIEPVKPGLRSPLSAPATPLEHKAATTPVVQPHSVTPPSGASRHKRKGAPVRAISKLTPTLPPPALPAPEILEREAAKFKTESFFPSTASISHSLLEISNKSVQSNPPDKKNPSAAATQLEASHGKAPRESRPAPDAHSSDSPSSSAHHEASHAGAPERPSPDPSEDSHPSKRRTEAPADPPEERKGALNSELVAAARVEEQGRGARAKKGGRASPKTARREEEAAPPPPPADVKPKLPPGPASNGPAATAAPAPSPAPGLAAPTSQTPSGPAPPTAPSPSVAQLPPPPPPSVPSSASTSQHTVSPSPDLERKGSNPRYSKRKGGKKGEEDGAKPAAPEMKPEPESQSEASQSQPAEVEPKRAKPRAKNAAVTKEAPVEPAAAPDETIAPRRAKLAVYFPQDYNQRTSKPSPQAGTGEAKDERSSDGDDSKDKSPKRKTGKRKGGAPSATEAPAAENEHLAPRRAKLAAYFPEDYKGEKEEGAVEGDDARSGQEDRQKYCICKRAYDNRSFMISCTRCKDWFHGTCIGIALQEAKRIKNFVCPRCEKRLSDK